MRVKCTDCLLSMRLRNSFNSLRLHGQQEMEHKQWRVLKVSAGSREQTPCCVLQVELHVWVFVCRCVHVFVSFCVDLTPALQDTPATVWILHSDTWLAVSLLEARLHRHLGDLPHYNMKSDQAEQPGGVAAQMWRICTMAMNFTSYFADVSKINPFINHIKLFISTLNQAEKCVQIKGR